MEDGSGWKFNLIEKETRSFTSNRRFELSGIQTTNSRERRILNIDMLSKKGEWKPKQIPLQPLEDNAAAPSQTTR